MAAMAHTGVVTQPALVQIGVSEGICCFYSFVLQREDQCTCGCLCINQGCLVIEINQYSKQRKKQPSIKLLSFEKQTRDHLQI